MNSIFPTRPPPLDKFHMFENVWVQMGRIYWTIYRTFRIFSLLCLTQYPFCLTALEQSICLQRWPPPWAKHFPPTWAALGHCCTPHRFPPPCAMQYPPWWEHFWHPGELHKSRPPWVKQNPLFRAALLHISNLHVDLFARLRRLVLSFGRIALGSSKIWLRLRGDVRFMRDTDGLATMEFNVGNIKMF